MTKHKDYNYEPSKNSPYNKSQKKGRKTLICKESKTWEGFWGLWTQQVAAADGHCKFGGRRVVDITLGGL